VTDLVKRLHYFNGQFLREPDFTAEQGYHVEHQRDHMRLLHRPGIAEGLDIPNPPAGATAVTINAGVAFDDHGRRIVLADNETLELGQVASGQTVFVTIAYAEAQSDPTDETGIASNTRWTEQPLIETSVTAPANPSGKLVLARIERTGTAITSIDRSARQIAGVKGGDLEIRGLTLTSESVAPSGWVKTQLGASGQADVAGSLRVTGDLTVSGSIHGDIAVGTVQAGDLVDNAVSTAKIADGAVTLQKLAAAVQPLVSIDGVGNPGGNVDLVQAGSVTVTPDATNRRITIGETHSARVDNPHATTAAQVGALPAIGGTLNGNLIVTGRIGIGAVPDFPLDVHGRMRARQMGATEETAGIWLSGYYQQELNAVFIGMQTQNSVGFMSGMAPPTWRMTVTLDKGDLTITGNAFKPGGGAWGVSSDERLKQGIQPLADALDRLLALRPIAFQWKEPEKHGNLTGTQMGFLAQDVESVFPEWVSVDAQGYRALTIRGFEALAVEALKQLKSENDKLREAYEQLLQRIDALEKKRSKR
jgi:Chaperone of endosialidase